MATQCSSPPSSATQQAGKFGGALHAAKTGCTKRFSSVEETFLGGIASVLIGNCHYSRSAEAQKRLETLVTTAASKTMYGEKRNDEDLGKMVSSQAEHISAMTLGSEIAEKFRCDKIGDKTLKNIDNYLETSSKASSPHGGFVDGCTDYYSGRYSKAQCQCIADVGRSMYPDIYDMGYHPSIIKSVIDKNPIIGLQITMQCHIGNY